MKKEFSYSRVFPGGCWRDSLKIEDHYQPRRAAVLASGYRDSSTLAATGWCPNLSHLLKVAFSRFFNLSWDTERICRSTVSNFCAAEIGCSFFMVISMTKEEEVFSDLL